MNTQPQYRRRQSQPATLLTQLPSVRRMSEDRQEEDFANSSQVSGPSEPTEDEVEAGNVENEWGTDHITRTGVPDRRFKENRALTEEDVGATTYRRAAVGRVVDGVHVTEEGIPDRRFKENRALSDEEIEIRRAELILAKHGRTKNEISPISILASHAPTVPSMPAVRPESPLARVARQSGTRQRAVSNGSPVKKASAASRRRTA